MARNLGRVPRAVGDGMSAIRFFAMKGKEDTPKVGIGVFLVRDTNIFLMRRKGSHGAGEWSLPGGHMKVGETFAETAAREVLEETGVVIDGVKEMGFTNDIMLTEGLHYVTLFFNAEWDTKQEPAIMEPEFCDAKMWTCRMPQNTWSPLSKFLKERRAPM
jgi:8-oxo-dGTP diphosphatase